MDFVHCQLCGHWPQFSEERARRYFITACGALFCEQCISSSGSNNKCPKCQQGQRTCHVVEVNGQASMDVKSYFMDPTVAFRDALKRPLQVLNFQQRLQKTSIKLIGQLNQTVKTLRAENQALQSELARERQTNETIKIQFEKLQAQLKHPQPTFTINSQGNEVLNLFHESPQRPNAYVHPITSPVNRTSPSFLPPQNNFSVRSHPLLEFNQPVHTPRSFPGQGSGRQNNEIFQGDLRKNFAQIRTGQQPTTPGRSPQFPISSQSSVASSVNSTSFPLPLSAGNTPQGRTPDLINRLRNLKCQRTPSAPFNH